MINKKFILTISIFAQVLRLDGQDSISDITDSLNFKGQLSSWVHVNPTNNLPLWIGGRYIPQLNYNLEFQNNHLLDFELSVNIVGNAGLQFSDTSTATGNINPYRAWARYSSKQYEIRFGLQKINFGSASLLRPLMWFDQIDPRDPLKLTNGVWGILGRFYFLNNANIWIWGLYGNKNPKGWEIIPTNKNYPEFGGRFQSPVPQGEVALSYHYRIADSREQKALIPAYSEISENRVGIDARFDLLLGCWFEGSWISNNKDLGMMTNQEILNLGLDYTIGIGNGIYIIYEQLIAAYDKTAFTFSNTISFSLLSIAYPVGLFDNLSTILYFDWKNKKVYNFVNWQKQFDTITLFIMGYWNPENYQIPTLNSGQNLYAGKGLQVMFVYNH